jgi:signal transduction histidine kinase
VESSALQQIASKAKAVWNRLKSSSSPVVVDTITTRFLLLFLFLLAIPLITVIIFTVSLLADHIDESGDRQLALSKNLFDAAVTNAIEKVELMEAFHSQEHSHSFLFPYRGFCKHAQAKLCVTLNYSHGWAEMSPGLTLPIPELERFAPDLPDAANATVNSQPFFSRFQNQIVLLNKVKLPLPAKTEIFLGAPIDFALMNWIYRQEPNLQTEIWVLGKSVSQPEQWQVLASSVKVQEAIPVREMLKALQPLNQHPEQLTTVELNNSLYRILPVSLYSRQHQKIGQVLHILPLTQKRMLLSNYYVGIYIISVASLLFSVLLAMAAGRTITQPLLKLISQVNTLSRENVSRHQGEVVVTGVHEIRQLGEAFNRMIKRLLQEHKMKDEFVATLTHDLKVPLLAEKQTLSYFINGSYGPVTSEQAEVLDTLQSSNKSCLSLVNGLLEVYRYDSGEVSLIFEPFNLTELMQETIAELQSLTVEKSLTLTLTSDLSKQGDEAIVFADRLEIKRVLHNLMSNAIINTPIHGSIQCRITNAKHYGSNTIYKVSSFQYTTLKHPLNLGDRLLVLIQDSGIGFSNDDLSSLFKQFAASKGRNPMSIGLGLYNCYQVLQAHNSILWVESTEGEGSLVSFALPTNQEATRDRRLFRDRRRNS